MHPYKVAPYECMYKNTALEGGMNNKAIFVLHTSLCLQETELFSINQRCPCLIKFCYKLVMALNCVNNPQSLAPYIPKGISLTDLIPEKMALERNLF